MQHEKSADLRMCAFPGGSQQEKSGVKLVIFSQISYLSGLPWQHKLGVLPAW